MLRIVFFFKTRLSLPSTVKIVVTKYYNRIISPLFFIHSVFHHILQQHRVHLKYKMERKQIDCAYKAPRILHYRIPIIIGVPTGYRDMTLYNKLSHRKQAVGHLVVAAAVVFLDRNRCLDRRNSKASLFPLPSCNQSTLWFQRSTPTAEWCKRAARRCKRRDSVGVSSMLSSSQKMPDEEQAACESVAVAGRNKSRQTGLTPSASSSTREDQEKLRKKYK